MYKELKITVTENSFLNDNMYTKEELFKIFKTGEDICWHYNITRNIFGYGSDCYDWENRGEYYLDTGQIYHICQVVDNEYIILYL